MSELRTYNPEYVIASFAGIPLRGFSADSMIKVMRHNDAVKMEVGAYGDTTRIISRDRTGEINISLMAASPTNDALSVVAQDDEVNLTGVGVFQLKELNGTTFVLAENAWIRKLPETDYKKGGNGDRVWILDCHVLSKFVGGNLT